MMTLPDIRIEKIQNYCGPQMYKEGKKFLKENPFFVTYREWTLLKALCEGNDMPSYAVRILLDEKGIANSCCTCYVNRSVPCKHIAALLIMWHNTPEAIAERNDWALTLKKSSKKDVVELIEKMVDLYPEHESCKLWLTQS